MKFVIFAIFQPISNLIEKERLKYLTERMLGSSSYAVIWGQLKWENGCKDIWKWLNVFFFSGTGKVKYVLELNYKWIM